MIIQKKMNEKFLIKQKTQGAATTGNTEKDKETGTKGVADKKKVTMKDAKKT